MQVADRIATIGFGAPSRVEELERARAAIAEILPRLAALLRSVWDPDARAVGDWSVADAAAHLSHVTAGELMVASTIASGQTSGLPVGDDLVVGAQRFNSNALANDPERRLPVLADRIEENAAEFLAVLADVRGDEPVGWLGELVLPASALPCHLIGEYLVHGFDIARAERRRWPMEPADAALGFAFLLDAIRATAPHRRAAFVDQHAAAGVSACYDLRIRGAGRAFLTFGDGSLTIEEPSQRRVDCHISGDPEALLLVGFNRIGPNGPALTGRMVVWGRKPWLALKLSSLLRNP